MRILREKLSAIYENLGLPRLIIITFFVVLLVAAVPLGLNVAGLLGDAVRRWAMYGVLVLAMVPGIESGINLNFGVSIGIVAGLLGSTIAIEMGMSNPWGSLAAAMLFGALVATPLGIGYGFLLNRVKGSEMTVSTYVGFSIVAFMNLVWLSLPFSSGTLIWPLGGKGLRNTISLSDSFGGVLNNFLSVTIGDPVNGAFIPTGLILFFMLMCVLLWLFMRSRTGVAMSAAGANPMFARASGIEVDRMRILGTTISTVLGAIGIITYSQSYGFLQLYNAPLMMGFHCVAAVLIGGATVKRARISHAIIGTFLFQGILAVALPVANKLLPGTNLADVMRIIISNGIILYALSKTKEGN